jgi:hypothetical protein
MPEGQERNGRLSWTLQVQTWHILLLLAVQLIALGVAYGRIVANQENTAAEIQQIKNRDVVTKDDWDAWRVELITRIDRLETKIDNEFINGK